MSTGSHVFPASRAGGLQSRLRRWLQDPHRILGPYVRPGMTVLDFGCGPGFFTIAAAHLVGEGGRVIAVDLQAAMLAKLRAAAGQAGVDERIVYHQCPADRIGTTTPVDLALVIFVAHEVPDQAALFRELQALVKPGGTLFVAEPAYVVSNREFVRTVALAVQTGFTYSGKPRMFLGRTALLIRS
jgi:ubiquinone/menaquinone biosynthesis C-methylase UbiE